MDSILSIKNRTKKRKDNQKDKVIREPIQIKKATYVEDYSIEIEKKLEEEGVYIPSMLSQPLVENSIWHGMAMLDEMGIIKIRIQTYNSKSVKITIEDNGIGMKKSLEYASKSSQHQHLGMQIIKKRLDLLSKKYKTETSINYSEYSPENDTKGTVVVIIMPLIYSIDDF